MSIRLNTKEQEKLVLDNYKLVGYVVRQLRSNCIDTEDLISVGTIGLIRVAAKYDKTKGIKFSTYAVKCIRNQIYLYFKDELIHLNNISLDAPVGTNNEEEQNNFYEMLCAQNVDIVNLIEDRDFVIRYINLALNVLDSRNRFIVLSRISGITLQNLSNILGISKQNISQREIKSKEKIDFYLSVHRKYTKIYNMDIVDKSYTISFSSNNVGDFNKIFADFLKKHTSTEDLIGLKVSYQREKVILRTPAQPKYLALIANIIREIDNYKLEFKG